MPMNRDNQMHFHRTLYSGMMEKIRLHKRNDDQRQVDVTTYIIHEARRSSIQKGGQTLDGDMNVDHTTVWHIPTSELRRVGINYLNPADVIEQLTGEEKNTQWQPEATTTIESKLFTTHAHIACLMLKPAVSRVGVAGY